MMRRGDEIAAIRDDDTEHSLKIDPIHGAVSVLLDCLLRIDEPSKRFEVLRKSVSEDAGLLTSAELIDLLHYRLDIFAEGEETPSIKANRERLREVIKALDHRILQASKDGELAQHPQFMIIAQKWRQFGRRTKPGEWVRANCQSDEQFVNAVTQLRSGPGLEDSGEPIDLANVLPLSFLIEVFGRDDMLQRCKRILEDRPNWLTTDQQSTLETLDDSLAKSSDG
jgi:hypothetical protein